MRPIRRSLERLPMNSKRANLRPFDAGHTDLLPGSCLSWERHPGQPAVQASLPTRASDCGAGRRHLSGHRATRCAGRKLLPQRRHGIAGKLKPTKARRSGAGWWLRSITGRDGRRAITIWRCFEAKLTRFRAVNQRRGAGRQPSLRLAVQFAREELSAFQPPIGIQPPANRKGPSAMPA
jgi:hypothetical protein